MPPLPNKPGQQHAAQPRIPPYWWHLPLLKVSPIRWNSISCTWKIWCKHRHYSYKLLTFIINQLFHEQLQALGLNRI